MFKYEITEKSIDQYPSLYKHWNYSRNEIFTKDIEVLSI
jgi:hypothetical protein